MVNTLIGQKIDQTQSFLENGNRVPLTEISVVDNVILQVKTLEKDKYSALQLGAGTRKKPTKGFLGHATKAGVKNAPLKIKEVKVDGSDMPKVGEAIKVDGVFKPGDIVQVTGVSKGKGFAGVVKRHGFGGGPKTHGQSDRHRAPGAIGQGTTPGRVYRGKRMAGRMGQDQVTVKNLVVLGVDSENNTLLVSGLIPGNKNSWVIINKIGEKKKFVPLLSEKQEIEPAASGEPKEATDVSSTDTKAEEGKAGDVQTDAAEAASEVKVDSSDESVETKEENKIEETKEAKTENVVVEENKEEAVEVKAEDAATQSSENQEVKIESSMEQSAESQVEVKPEEAKAEEVDVPASADSSGEAKDKKKG